MSYTWDPEKARSNRRKHGVDFADAVGVFEDPFALTASDPHPHEARFATLGRDFLDRIVVVVWTHDEGNIRPIMARRATPRQRRAYSEGIDE
jgi:hypothetical protein